MSLRGDRAHRFFSAIQAQVAEAIVAFEGAETFRSHPFSTPEGASGLTLILENGTCIERAAVNVSRVRGNVPPGLTAELPSDGDSFFATGVSIIVHPRSPHAPTCHANFRYLERGRRAAWYGGGSDLTPAILYAEDAIHFHRTWKMACDPRAILSYETMKAHCDRYFVLPHRNEARGVGGIFFDYVGDLDGPQATYADLESVESWVAHLAHHFLPAYRPILERRARMPWTDDEREWQLVRRGRYVEFNLLCDRGTSFGLKSGGRVESIFASLPPLVAWTHDRKAQTPQEKALMDVLLEPRDWLASP